MNARHLPPAVAVTAAWAVVAGPSFSLLVTRLDHSPAAAHLGRWGGIALSMTVACAYAVTVALAARDPRRRNLALGAVALIAGFWLVQGVGFAVLHDVSFEVLIAWSEVTSVAGLVVPVLAVAAWGVARRDGRWWMLGLIATLVLAVGFEVLSPYLFEAFHHLFDVGPYYDNPLAWWSYSMFISALGLVPIVLGILVGWLIARPQERSAAARQRDPETAWA